MEMIFPQIRQAIPRGEYLRVDTGYYCKETATVWFDPIYHLSVGNHSGGNGLVSFSVDGAVIYIILYTLVWQCQ